MIFPLSPTQFRAGALFVLTVEHMAFVDVRRSLIQMQRPIQNVDVLAKTLVELLHKFRSDLKKFFRGSVAFQCSRLIDAFFWTGFLAGKQILGRTVSVCLQAVPARSPPAYGFFLVRSCRGGTSPKKHSGLQPIMLLSKYNVCKKSRAFKSTSGTVLKSSPYTLYKFKGVFLNRLSKKFRIFSLFQSPLYL